MGISKEFINVGIFAYSDGYNNGSEKCLENSDSQFDFGITPARAGSDFGN
jgi:hypothetical protein